MSGKHPSNTVFVSPKLFFLQGSWEVLSVRSLFCLYPYQYNTGIQSFFQEYTLLILHQRQWGQVLLLSCLHVLKIFSKMEKTNRTLRKGHWFQGQKWYEIICFLIAFQKDTSFQLLYKANISIIIAPRVSATYLIGKLFPRNSRDLQTPRKGGGLAFFCLKAKYPAHTSCLI